MRTPNRWFSIVCVTLLCVSLDAAFAGSGGVISLPAYNGNKKMTNGIIAEIDTRWTNGWGYRPIVVKLNTGRAKRDRRIRVVLMPESNYRPGFGGVYDPLAVSVNVDIPKGSKEVTKTVYVPQQSPWLNIRVEFFEGRKKLKDLSMDWGFSWEGDYDNNSPCVLMVDKDAPSLREDRQIAISRFTKAASKELPDAVKFQFIANNAYNQRSVDESFFRQRGRATDAASLRELKQLSNVEIIPPRDIPPDPIGLAGIDLMLIPIDEFDELANQDPKRFHAVDFFVRNGGHLVVYGSGKVPARVSSHLDHTLPWKPANTSFFRAEVDGSYQDLVSSEDPALAVTRRRQKAELPEGVPPFFVSDHGFGRIVAIDAVDPYGESVAFWQWVMREIGLDRLTWPERHGVSLVSNNSDYWDFMIPGYGQSPVETFLGVITIFILMIGPLNVYLLKRFKRLYLLPVTVAIAALLTTICMLGYAMVSDGVITRVRLRSYTQIDHQENQNIAMTFCRHSYLAAITPSRGLVFPDHTCVYPITPFNQADERKETLLENQHQRALSRGYIRSRTTTQFLTTDVQTTSHGIQPQDDGFENRIGVELSYVWLVDAEGNMKHATKAPANQLLQLESVDVKEAMKTYSEIFADNRPAPPPGLDKTSNNSMFGSNYSRMYYYQARPVYSSTSLLSENMSKAADFFRRPQPNTYLVITIDAPPFVHQGTSASQEAGFHIVRGSW